METREQRIARVEEETRRESQRLGFELITTAGVTQLAGISKAAVTHAVRQGRVHAPYRVTAATGGPTVTLLNLDSVLEYWARRLPDNAAEIVEQMRAHCHIMGIGRLAYNILHPEPIWRVSDANA